jgi:hypothetical protein
MAIQEEGERVLWDIIKLALTATIKAHGPVTKDNLGSAIKRIVHGIIESEDLQRYTSEDIWNKVRADALEVYYKGEISILRKRNSELRSEIAKLKNGEAGKEIARLKNELATLPAKQYWIEKLQATVEQLNKEKIEIRKQLEEIKGTDKVKKLKVIRHQLTNKIAHKLWEFNDKRDGYAEQDWLLAEKLADALLAWKPNGKDTYYVYAVY